MFNNIEPSRLYDVLSLLGPMISVKFNESLAKWFCISWKYLEEKTLDLMRYIKEQYIDDNLSNGIATLSKMVLIGDVTAYYSVAVAFA